MTPSGDGGEHVQLLLGLYVLGALSPAEDSLVEAHLLRCDTCLIECDELGEAAVMFSWLPRGEFVERNGGRLGVGRRDSVERVGAGVATAAARSAVTVGRGSASGRARRYSGRVRLTMVAAVAVLVVGVGVWWGSGKWSGVGGVAVPVAEVAASASDGATGAMMSVVVRDADGGVEVRAVVVGLRPEMEFELVALDGNGRRHPVVRGTAAGGPQTVVGRSDLALGDIRFFTVGELNGSVLVSVQFSATAAPR